MLGFQQLFLVLPVHLICVLFFRLAPTTQRMPSARNYNQVFEQRGKNPQIYWTEGCFEG